MLLSPLPTHRIGLAFAPAPVAPADPLRTDIALFVGLLARRVQQDSAAPVVLPPLLAAWLSAQHIGVGAGPALTAGIQMRLQRARVRLDTVADFSETLALACAPADAAVLRAWFTALPADRRTALEALLQCVRTTSTLPAATLEDLRARGHTPQRVGDAEELRQWLRVQRLHNMPVCVEGQEAFEALFEAVARPIFARAAQPGDAMLAPPTAAALRAFFGEGGQRVYVVRTGDPLPVLSTPDALFAAAFPAVRTDDRCALLPQIAAAPGTAPVALASADWQGLEHAYGLPDASFALLPDLPELAATPPDAVAPPEVVAVPQRFADCVEGLLDTAPQSGRRLPPPRLDAEGLARWRRWLLRAADLLDNGGRSFHRRDLQLIASLPLLHTAPDLPGPDDWLAWMARDGGWLDERGTAPLLCERLQLAWPWLLTTDSGDCAGAVEAPEGALAGVLARNALARGSFRSAARQPLHRFLDTEPRPSWSRLLESEVATPLGPLVLAERVCLLGPAPAGARLLSDASCAQEPVFRQASVRRLVNVVIQTTRRLGDQHAFEPNGELLWARLRSQVGDLLRRLQSAGALTTDGGASTVRCGRDTMNQSDLDNGRLIVEIALRPAQPVQRILVVLDLRGGGGAVQAQDLAVAA